MALHLHGHLISYEAASHVKQTYQLKGCLIILIYEYNNSLPFATANLMVPHYSPDGSGDMRLLPPRFFMRAIFSNFSQ